MLLCSATVVVLRRRSRLISYSVLHSLKGKTQCQQAIGLLGEIELLLYLAIEIPLRLARFRVEPEVAVCILQVADGYCVEIQRIIALELP